MATRQVRALTRGLDVLHALNRKSGRTARDLAESTGLPRPTVYRLLETLEATGYVARDAGDDRYRVTNRVRALADGFDDEAWVIETAIPLMRALCESIVWPVSLATIDGDAMLVRVTTDSQSPLATTYFATGDRLPIMGSAVGRAYLAFCGEPRSTAILELISKSDDPANRVARNPTQVARLLGDTRRNGYAYRAKGPFGTVSFAVPIMGKSGVAACLSMRYFDSAMTVAEGAERFVPTLRTTAESIATVVS